ncbi:MAG: ABC transporter substrate-binding protein [Candidatus Omnitrophica bacterium]|nr:ABC transporter substrate-binding protein [Candidatus Omnitrophota bacterium]
MIRFPLTLLLIFCLLLIFSLKSDFAAAAPFNLIIIKSRDITPYNEAVAGFMEALNQNGYKEGKDLHCVYYSMDTQKDIDIISEIKAKTPDLLLTLGSEAAKFISAEIKDIPGVFSMVLFPVENKIVKNMESPGNNFSGASMNIPVEIQFRMIKKVIPGAKNIGVMYDPDKSSRLIEEAKKAALQTNIELVALEVHSAKDVPGQFRNLIRQIDVLWTIADNTVLSRESMKFILSQTLEKKIPCFGISKPMVVAGALLALDCDFHDIGRQSGEIACKILEGAKPGKLPVSVSRNQRLILNLKTAKWLGLQIAEDILKNASEVIK